MTFNTQSFWMVYARAINCFQFLLSAFLFAIFVLPILLFFLIFFVYRTIILIILKLKFKSTFGSIMSGTDAFFAAETGSKNVINTMMIVRTKHTFQELFHQFKEILNVKVFQNPQQFPKFLSRRYKMCGYHYYVKNQVEINECIRRIDFNCKNEEISKEVLLKEISNYSNQPLPYNSTGFWEVVLGEKPVTWNNRIDKSEKAYVILIRLHHSLADGITLFNMLLHLLTDDLDREKKAETLPTPTDHNALHNLKIKIYYILDSILVLLRTPIVVISQKFFRHVEVSSLDVPPALISDQQILVAKVEESRECLKIIKGIKNKAKDTSFVDVLGAAISKSFSNYFQKKGKDPNLTSLHTCITILMKNLNYLQMTGEKPFKLKNGFSYASMNLPIIYTTTEPSSYWKSFMDTLEKVKIETKHWKTSPDYKVTYGIIQRVTYFCPESIFLRVVSPSWIPLIITNIPGPSTITLFGDSITEDVVFWIPRIDPIGLSLGFLTYDERLQISLSVDKAIISDEQEAQEIVDGIYQALIHMDSKI